MRLGAVEGLRWSQRVGVELRKAPQDGAGPTEPARHRPVILVERRHGLAEAGHDALGVLQSIALGAQRLFLPIPRVDGVDLGELEPVEILLPRLLSHLLLEMLLSVARVPPGAHQMRHTPRCASLSAEAVEQAELPLGLEQPLVLVLAVELHEVLAEPLQEPDRRRRVVDVDPVPSGARDLPLHDELALTRGVAGLVEHGGQRAPAIDVEYRLDGGQILAGADQVGWARAPSTSRMASTRMDLPAPVSP